MVTLHHNGDIVTCPDHANNYQKRQSYYSSKNLCRYGEQICYCQHWQKYHEDRKDGKPYKKDLSYCAISGTVDCPHYQKIVERANLKKSYAVTNRHFRRLADQAAFMKENAKHKLLFITLTFSNWKKDEITDKQANECFSKFMENLKTSKCYSRGNYIAVRERGENGTKRLHYHCIIELPFVNLMRVNNAWNSAISEYCHYSKNALTTPHKKTITSTVGAIKYVCKYISKCRGQQSDTRIIFTSRQLAQAELTKDFSGNDLQEVLRQFGSIQVHKHHEFCWRYNISCPADSTPEQKEKTRRAQIAFYNQVVRVFFGYSDRKHTEITYFSTE